MKVLTRSFFVLLVLSVALNGFVLAQNSGDQKQATKSLVNINTASQSDLERLPGIGPSLAKKILEFRQKNGNFKNPSDLMAVSGVGEKKYEQLKNLITVK